MSVAGLVEQLSELEDPRLVGKVDHHLTDILVIACAESWLRRFLDLVARLLVEKAALRVLLRAASRAENGQPDQER